MHGATERMEPVAFAPGEVIIETSNTNSTLFLIMSGSVAVGPFGTMAKIEAGGTFGELGLISDEVFKEPVVAQEQTTLLRISRLFFRSTVLYVNDQVRVASSTLAITPWPFTRCIYSMHLLV